MLEKFPIFLSIFSATIISLLCLIKNKSLYETAIELIFVIIIFYILGLVVRFYLINSVFIEKKDIEVIEEIEFMGNED